MSEFEITEQFENFQSYISLIESDLEEKIGKTTLDNAKENIKKLSHQEIQDYKNIGLLMIDKMIEAIKNNTSFESKEIQDLMERSFEATKLVYPDMTKLIYESQRELVLKTPEIYSRLHPSLPQFLYDAMGVFAKKL